ncbi:MAG: pilus assembly protein PilP [Magnetococcales bacterium]|nr:pilus assembly protein PilP [Magnetococcales bacterium]
MFFVLILLAVLFASAEPVLAEENIALDATVSWSYKKTDKRNPFQPPPELAAAMEATRAGPAPEEKPKRVKEFLESFQIDSLKLVATVFRIEGHVPVAMVEDPMGVGHLVQPGQYLGTNEGRIIEINDGTVIVEERLPDPNAPKPTRTVTLKLPSEVKK